MDIRLHYICGGSGTPVILLHGNGEDHSYFAHQMEELAARFTVYAVDTRGHGASPRGSAPFTLEQFAADLLDFMDAQNIQKAHLVGFSDGGNIALLFALAHPQRVERLVLNGANLDPGGLKLQVRLPILLEFFWSSLAALFSPAAKAKRELLGLMVTQPNITSDRLAALNIPTLVVAGDHDMIQDSHTRLIARSIPGAKLCILPGSHFVAAENSSAFNDVVLYFLTEE